MEEGVAAENYKKVLAITDRKQAIKTACQLAQPNDIILIAGKGMKPTKRLMECVMILMT
jgi:UDP-N-acetylmuramoyl-L-alanyl-D-glutamate--2,6-diaminopimelate ligase